MKSEMKNGITALLWKTGVAPTLRSFREPRVLALAYHSIWNKESKDRLKQELYKHISIREDVFLEQLRYVQKRGYIFRQFHEIDAKQNNFQGKEAYLYFDDGFLDVYENVYPILKREGIPATFFVTTDYIEQKGSQGVYASWDQIRAMRDVFEIGSHAISHKKLNKIPLEDARLEMLQSKKIIEDAIGAPVFSFSYPHGRSNDELEKAAHDAGYKITTADRYFHKTRPDPEDSLNTFKWKILF